MEIFWEFVKNNLIFIIGGIVVAGVGISYIYEEIFNFWGCKIVNGEIENAKLKYDTTYRSVGGSARDYKYIHRVRVENKVYTTKNKLRYERKNGKQVKVFFNEEKRKCELINFWFLPGYIMMIVIGVWIILEGFGVLNFMEI